MARAKDVFLRVLDAPEQEREERIARACAGDAALEARVRALLEAHEEAERLLGDEVRLGAELREVAVGDAIGPYRLTRFVGEGGFGLVFEAEQSEPVRRTVAIKVVKAGMDTRQVVRRFETERQALAIMDHPGIARVFDAGTTVAGRPYFVMEYLDGEPITRYCEERRLGTTERLELFHATCLAVRHAHQKGVIHRDIKPTNILVCTVDGEPLPKVIDFGIAKAMDSRVAEHSLVTGAGNVVGTPAYMSPEQLEGAPDIDTRTDVYALGALLYQLLAGEPPFAPAPGRSTSFLELQRRILETEAPAPSRRRRSLPAERAGEGTTDEFSRELDWIVLRCLEKDRARRYPTANALAEDVRRYLAHEPIEAAPPARLYRFRKLVRRHRLASLFLAAAVLALVVGAVGTTLGLLAARRGEAAARREHDDVLRLSMFERLEDLQGRADELWPARPALVPAYEDWLRRAEELVSALDSDPGRPGEPGLRGVLEELRARAVSEDPADREARLRRSPRYEEWRRKQAERDAAAVEDGDPAELEALEAELAELEAEVGLGRELAFESEDDTWWYAQLSKLVREVEAFGDPQTGLIDGLSPRHGPGVRRRLALASTIEEASVTGAEARERWALACGSIADPSSCPAYGGLELEPQLGLLPIGQDPGSGLWEFACLETGEPPERDELGRLVIGEESAVVLVLVPGGDFLMGAQTDDPLGPNHDPLAQGDEQPLRAVTLSPFFLSKYELTQGQWLRATGTNPSRYDPSMDFLGRFIDLRHPVEQVSWDDARRVLARVDLTLPTEAQWEYAARAGTTTAFYTGATKDTLEGHVNLADRSALAGGARWPAADEWPELEDGYATHAPVGSYLPNPFGLHDVLGNVWEWCLDGYHERLYAQVPEPSADPLDPPDGSRSRVNRGGGFANGPSSARCANRDPLKPDSVTGSVGVRPARPVRPAGGGGR